MTTFEEEFNEKQIMIFEKVICDIKNKKIKHKKKCLKEIGFGSKAGLLMGACCGGFLV